MAAFLLGVMLAFAAGVTAVPAAASPPARTMVAQSAYAKNRLVPAGFAVKPSDVVAPAGTRPGQYLRLIRPFPNWTLVCDEDLKRRTKICNISQTILQPNGSPVFSWSLAASDSGEPFFILRTPPGLGRSGVIRFDLPNGAPPVLVPVKGCEPTLCIAYQPVTDTLRGLARRGAALRVSLQRPPAGMLVQFVVPLAGLDSALDAI